MSSFIMIVDDFVYLFFGQYITDPDDWGDSSSAFYSSIKGEYYTTTFYSKEEIEEFSKWKKQTS